MRKLLFSILRQFFVTKPVTRRKRITKNRGEYLALKEKAREIVTTRLAHFNQHYGYSWNRVSIKNQKTRWGSCSSKGNLNFSYKIALLPAHIADYIIVHELCHLAQMNHSKNFWDLVAETIPNHREIRNELRKRGRDLK